MVYNFTPPQKTFNELEIHPCRTIKKGNGEKKDIVEQCDEKEAEFWSVYVHYLSGGLDCVADCWHKHEAEELVKFLKGFSKHSLF